jgi:hypothetical protein
MVQALVHDPVPGLEEQLLDQHRLAKPRHPGTHLMLRSGVTVGVAAGSMPSRMRGPAAIYRAGLLTGSGAPTASGFRARPGSPRVNQSESTAKIPTAPIARLSPWS